MKDNKVSQKDLKNALAKAKEVMSNILDMIGLKNYSLEIEINENSWIEGRINYQDQGILIGHKGETLASLQLVVRLALYRQLGFWVPFILDVGDYLKSRNEHLKQVAQNLSQKVKFSQEIQELNDLNSAERRIVHVSLKDHPDVTTESIDTKYGRKLLIKPKN